MKKSVLFIALLLTACQSPEEIQAAKERQMQADYDACVQDYGFKPKSDAARNCMLQIELARQQQNDYYYGASYWDRHPHFGSGIYYLGH
jgi:hypothetical protein